MGLDENGYYSLREILGYNAKVNFVMSDRGRGKSYGTKLFLMNQEGRFMCLYRNVTDVETAVGSWLDTLYENGYQPEQFEWNMGKGSCELLYCGAVKGYFRALTQVNHIKQEKFPDDVNWIWFDEFIPLVYKKLPGVVSEGDAIRAIMKTVDHDTTHPRESKGLKPLRVLLYANPFTWDNPILSYFKVIPRGYGIWRVGPDIVCEMLPPIDKTEGGKQTMDDFLGDEVHRNQAWADQSSFVMPIPKGAEPVYSIRLDKEYYTLYRTQSSNIGYIKQHNAHTNARTKLGTLTGLSEDERIITSQFKSYLDSWTRSSALRYDTINTKFNWIRAITNLIL
jgi:hypothetical protein|nr:MAG TPA: Terminase [Caudoviricetes sp.]